jgi:hypothetical protein
MSRSTKLGPGGNSGNYNVNKYKGNNGIGATSLSNYSALKRLASFCKNDCNITVNAPAPAPAPAPSVGFYGTLDIINAVYNNNNETTPPPLTIKYSYDFIEPQVVTIPAMFGNSPNVISIRISQSNRLRLITSKITVEILNTEEYINTSNFYLDGNFNCEFELIDNKKFNIIPGIPDIQAYFNIDISF